MNKQLHSFPKPLDLALSAKQDITQALRQRFQSRELFGSEREVIIDHAGEEYRLSLRRQGKLILTK